MKRLAPLALAILVGCQLSPSTPDTAAKGAELVVLHTRTAMLTAPASAVRERLRVEDFYPAACFDRDDDDDGIPGVLDDDDDGASDDSDDDDDDDVDGGSGDHRCKRCNRGPGTQGDFRFDVRGTSAELDRGRVHSRTGDQLVVTAPDGLIRINLVASTEVRDGEPNPGAEIRVEGTLVGAPADRVIEAARLKVLCPAPAPLPDDRIPEEATPVPPTGGNGGAPDGGLAEGAGASGGGAPVGATCSAHGDCLTGNCAADPTSGTKSCGTGASGSPCAAASDCGGLQCVGNVCQPRIN